MAMAHLQVKRNLQECVLPRTEIMVTCGDNWVPAGFELSGNSGCFALRTASTFEEVFPTSLTVRDSRMVLEWESFEGEVEIKFGNRTEFEAFSKAILLNYSRILARKCAWMARHRDWYKSNKLFTGTVNEAPPVGIPNWAIREYKDERCWEKAQAAPLPPDSDDDDDNDDDDNDVGAVKKMQRTPNHAIARSRLGRASRVSVAQSLWRASVS